MMKKVLTGLVLLCSAAPAQDTTLQRTSAILPLQTFHISPYSNPYLPDYGLASAIIATALDLVDMRSQVSFSTFDDAFQNVKTANAAGIFPVYKNTIIETDLILSDPLLDFEIYKYERAASPSDIAPAPEPQALPKKICIANPFKNLVTGFIEEGEQPIYEPHPHACFLKLKNLEVAAVIDEKKNADLYGPLFFGPGDLVSSDKPLITSTYHLGISKLMPDGPSIIENFNEGLKRARKHGKIQEIQNQFMFITKT